MTGDRPLFLERASFRRRRLGDAARVLPVLAMLLMLLPVWWSPVSLSYAAGAVWIFGTWAVLIVAVWLLHRALLRSEAATLRASQDPLHPADAPRDRTRDPDAV
ncbi:MAG: hypothetical protein ABGX10_08820 [Paracoccus sp. (in: a-proteobacteria)]|uniref:hypothetical protein n=1 Tax=unclassified Paracoccus (in: a-proteobacteria) TaxID=2688777 RepID=UPI00093125F8|nr:hypothetical protein [Paracoccus sp. SM22M-07]